MAKVLNSSGVTSRRSMAITLIESGLIHSQEDLVSHLRKAGYVVTQATASRDLEEIGAVRGRSKSGQSTYVISTSRDESISRSMPLPSDLILSVESSGNLAVVRTPPGGAGFLASSLDRSGIQSIIGTIAGDDTVLVVSAKATGGAHLAKELLAIAMKKKARVKKVAKSNRRKS